MVFRCRFPVPRRKAFPDGDRFAGTANGEISPDRGARRIVRTMKRNDGTARFLRRKRAVPCFRSWTAGFGSPAVRRSCRHSRRNVGFLYRVFRLKADGLGKFVAVSPDRRATGSGVVPMPVPCRPGGAACIRYTGGVRESHGCGAGGAFRSVRTNAQTLWSCPQSVGRQDRQTLRSRILSRRVFRRVLSDIIMGLARRWRDDGRPGAGRDARTDAEIIRSCRKTSGGRVVKRSGRESCRVGFSAVFRSS